MTRLLVLLLLGAAVTASSRAQAAPLAIDWLRIVAGADTARVEAVATRPDGSVVIAGAFQGSKILGQTGVGNEDAFVAVFRPGGKLRWARVLGGTGHDWATSIAVGPDNSVYVAGATESDDLAGETSLGQRDAFVARYGPGGALSWVARLGGDGIDGAGSVATGVRAGATVIAVAGTTGSDTFEGIVTPALTDAFVAWLSSAGTLAEAEVYGGSGGEIGWGVAMGGDGSTYLVGNTSSGDAPAGAPSPGLSGVRGMLVKYRADNARAWVRFVGSGQETLTGVTLRAGRIYVVGSSTGATLDGETGNGGSDVIVARYRPGGARTWLRLLGTDDNEGGEDVSVAADGRVYVAAVRSPGKKGAPPPGASDTQVLVYRMSADGVVQRHLELDGEATDDAAGIAAPRKGSWLFVAGSTTSATFAGKKTSPNDHDGFLARLR